MGEVWVKVDLLGMGDTAALTTKRLNKLASPLDFGFSTSINVGRGSPGHACGKCSQLVLEPTSIDGNVITNN